MKAIVSIVRGGPEQLQYMEIPAPAPGDDEALIAVQACGVNYPDNLIIQDQYQVKVERPFSPGSEVCGWIEAVGKDVTTLKVGERVIGRCGWGGMAEYVCVPAAKCLKIDSAMPASEAATFVFAYATAYYALRNRAHVKPGETVLVLGAGGGVGSAAVELARALGARVLAAASSGEKVELAKRLGAEAGLVYQRGLEQDGMRELGAAFKRLAGNAGVDIVYDPVGGPYCEPALRTLNVAGRHLVVGFTAGIPTVPLNLALLKSCQIVGVDWRSFNMREPIESAANVQELLALYRQGRIRPYISRSFSLKDGAAAIRHLSSRDAIGKVVVVNDVNNPLT